MNLDESSSILKHRYRMTNPHVLSCQYVLGGNEYDLEDQEITDLSFQRSHTKQRHEGIDLMQCHRIGALNCCSDTRCPCTVCITSTIASSTREDKTDFLFNSCFISLRSRYQTPNIHAKAYTREVTLHSN